MASWTRQALATRIGKLCGTQAPAETGTAAWLADAKTVSPDPVKTMTVRVVWRGDGPDYIGAYIWQVTIPAVCPQCGGPRGEPRPHHFCEDGEWLTCDCWDNPCGHRDMYTAVIAEARAIREAAGQ